jgi:uncharacterized damage-inducible protein DinB
MEPLIASYAKGHERLKQAVAGVTEEELMFKQAPDQWSIKEIVIHLCDAEVVAVHRIKKVISEPNPQLLAFDQDRWSSRLTYQEQDHELQMEIFRLLRLSLIPVLSKLASEDWSRSSMHNENGAMTLQEIVEHFVNHTDQHLQQIDRVKLAFAAR